MSPPVQKVHHLLDVALLIIDGLVLLKYKRCTLVRHAAAACICVRMGAVMKQSLPNVTYLSVTATNSGAPMSCSYFERAIRMAFSARAMRFVTISPTMRKLAGALFQTIVPILTVLGFCEHPTRTACPAAFLCQLPPPVLWDTTLTDMHRCRCLLRNDDAFRLVCAQVWWLPSCLRWWRCASWVASSIPAMTPGYRMHSTLCSFWRWLA